jgi:hypothetical protein
MSSSLWTWKTSLHNEQQIPLLLASTLVGDSTVVVYARRRSFAGLVGVTTFGGSRVLDEALEALGGSLEALEVTCGRVFGSVLVLEGWDIVAMRCDCSIIRDGDN